jgi:hypothetical protein
MFGAVSCRIMQEAVRAERRKSPGDARAIWVGDFGAPISELHLRVAAIIESAIFVQVNKLLSSLLSKMGGLAYAAGGASAALAVIGLCMSLRSSV